MATLRIDNSPCWRTSRRRKDGTKYRSWRVRKKHATAYSGMLKLMTRDIIKTTLNNILPGELERVFAHNTYDFTRIFANGRKR